ncbi:Cof-type HAD-IIB family hydrolase [Candidatus Xianfuyuplasma coldseepsis]|uniref:HAD family phosphatase n=1 Tax=Candidatus Xianfuyuplasma coldseepsis TaxID=2782163 RepID=A0A7L7KSM1_9MOLU|nr:Cof-type HAD-IIB family hydrolase [Xianfuyuplasma coldseepsis]QMS85409.1 HAD family phosphatase [Xianfuyuplasma coldseepsis]
MEKYLIALDLDGTLLADWQTITPKTKKYLRSLSQQGHDIVIATGRPFRSSEEFYDQLGLTSPIINYNGGLITNKHDPDFDVRNISIPKEYIYDIVQQNKDIIKNAFGEVLDDIFLWHDTEEIRPLLHYFNGAKLTVGHFEDILHEDPNGFLIVCHQGQAQHLEDFIADKYKDRVLARNWGSFYNYVIELYTPETNKGLGLQYVAEHLGYDQDHIIAFGDAHNDIEMLRYAGLGVAMKNAQDRLKVHADDITEYDNTEDGLVHYLTSFFKTKQKHVKK